MGVRIWGFFELLGLGLRDDLADVFGVDLGK